MHVAQRVLLLELMGQIFIGETMKGVDICVVFIPCCAFYFKAIFCSVSIFFRVF